MKVYKLTDHNMQTYCGLQWHTTNGEGELCGPGWLHHYTDPLLAILFNPIHAGFLNPRLFEAESGGKVLDDELKRGSTRLRLIQEILLPTITTEQKVKFAIFCALEVYKKPVFVQWAKKWLNNEDRSLISAINTAADTDAITIAAERTANFAAHTATSAVVTTATINLTRLAHLARPDLSII